MIKKIRKMVALFQAPIAGIILSLALSCLLLAAFGESPWLLLESIQASLFTSFGLGYTLYYTTPLIFTGLAVAVCFHCGLFNIGAEGQLYVGALFALGATRLFPNLPFPLAIAASVIASMVGGGLWAGFCGVLKAYRGSHEVITTILMNFIAWALVDWVILYPWRNPESQNSESFIVGENYRIATLSDLLKPLNLNWFETTPVNLSLFFAVIVSVIIYFILFRTAWGYELRSVGLNPVSSRFAGISVKKNIIFALTISGACAGLVGVNEVLGSQHRLIQGFSPGYGFTGIAVALLARSHPIGLCFSALLFGSLQNSARELEFMSEKVSKELSLIIQALIVAFVACNYWVEEVVKRRRKAKEAHDSPH